MRDNQTGVVLLYHGSASESAAAAERAMASAVCDSEAFVGVEVAHLSDRDVGVSSLVAGLAARGARQVVVVPMFLAPGGHVQRDVPRIVAACKERCPGVTVSVSTILGGAPGLTKVVADLIASTARPG